MQTQTPASATPVRPVVLETHLSGLPARAQGKVRDIYDLGDHLLLIATDRISAFDVVLPTGIPDKGRVLNQISAFWFRRLANICPHHCVTIDTAAILAALRASGVEASEELLAGRAMLCRKARPLPVEFVMRGYLDGSAWREYQRSRSVCGIPLPPGLRQGDRLPEPIFTPTTKAHTGHDEPITFAEMLRLDEADYLHQAVEYSRQLYATGADYARERGILLADTKFEFGVRDGQVILIDEVLTPDSSRFWDAARWQPGGPQPSFDKQFVRDWLDASGWNHQPPAPELPGEVVRATADRYREIYRRLTGAEPC